MGPLSGSQAAGAGATVSVKSCRFMRLEDGGDGEGELSGSRREWGLPSWGLTLKL